MKKIFLSLMVCQTLAFSYTDTEQDNLIDENTNNMFYLEKNVNGSYVKEFNEFGEYVDTDILRDTGINQILYGHQGKKEVNTMEGATTEEVDEKGLIREIYGQEEISFIDFSSGEEVLIQEAEEGIIDKVQHNENDITTLKAKDIVIEEKVDINIIDITELKAKDIDLESQIFSSKANNNINTTNIADNRTDINTNTNNFNSLESSLFSTNVNVADNRKDINTNINKNVEQDTRIAGNRTDINTNINKNVEQDTRLDNQRTDINTNTNNVNSLKATDRVIIKNVSNNSNRLDNHDNRLNTQRADINTNKDEIKNVNSKLENFMAKSEDTMDIKIASSLASQIQHNYNGGNISVGTNIAIFNGKVGLGLGIGYRKNSFNETNFNIGVSENRDLALKVSHSWSFSLGD